VTLQRHPVRNRFERTEGGFALVVVLILVTAMALIVGTQVQRGTSVQALATNSSRYLQAETAAQTALRYCEAAMLSSVGASTSVRVTAPGVRGVDGPAWRDAGKWKAAAVNFGTTGITLPGVSSYECLYEDASGELVPSVLAHDVNPEAASASPSCAIAPGISPRMCKYRVNARVKLDDGAQFTLQSEVRFAI
jgi:Tfp pilus assembly protein PilX